MAWLEYLLMMAVGLFALWLVGWLDDWLANRDS